MFKLGRDRGVLTDYVTQLWIRWTGREVELKEVPWLKGPIGDPSGIGSDFFRDYAASCDCEFLVGDGLIRTMSELDGPDCNSSNIHRSVRQFYEHTSRYELQAWSEWSGVFRPLGRLLAVLFSRRLQQLNVPLSNLDASRGIESRVYKLVSRGSGQLVSNAWVRTYVASKHVLYAGEYSTCNVPSISGGCVKVVFPLPNGNATVIMKPTTNGDGSLTLSSSGNKFGDPGFYFTVHWKGRIWAKYVRSMRETIHVYGGGQSDVRADHVLRIWGFVFLRIHYQLRYVQFKLAAEQ